MYCVNTWFNLCTCSCSQEHNCTTTNQSVDNKNWMNNLNGALYLFLPNVLSLSLFLREIKCLNTCEYVYQKMNLVFICNRMRPIKLFEKESWHAHYKCMIWAKNAWYGSIRSTYGNICRSIYVSMWKCMRVRTFIQIFSCVKFLHRCTVFL